MRGIGLMWGTGWAGQNDGDGDGWGDPRYDRDYPYDQVDPYDDPYDGRVDPYDRYDDRVDPWYPPDPVPIQPPRLPKPLPPPDPPPPPIAPPKSVLPPDPVVPLPHPTLVPPPPVAPPAPVELPASFGELWQRLVDRLLYPAWLEWGPLLLTVLSWAFAVAVLLWILRDLRLWRTWEGARWLEITPPARMPAEGVQALPAVLAGVLSGMRSRRGVKPRVALEWFAEAGRSRVGLWVPGDSNTDRWVAAVGKALPGARVKVCDKSPVAFLDYQMGRPLAAGREIRPEGGQWAVLVEPAPRGARGVAARAATQTGEEPLRGVWSTVANSEQHVLMQMVITVYRWQSRGFSLDVGELGKLGGLGLLKLLEWALIGFLAVCRAVIDIFLTPSSSSSSSSSRSTSGGYAGSSSGNSAGAVKDPAVAARERAVAFKRAARPLLHVTLRVAGLEESARVGASLASEVAGDYSLAVTQVGMRSKRAWWFVTGLKRRAPGRGFYATVAEVGALWHLPAEPELYHLPSAVARDASKHDALDTLPHMPGTGPTRPGGPSGTTRPPRVRRPSPHDWRGRTRGRFDA